MKHENSVSNFRVSSILKVIRFRSYISEVNVSVLVRAFCVSLSHPFGIIREILLVLKGLSFHRLRSSQKL